MPRSVPAGWALLAALGAGTVRMDAQAPDDISALLPPRQDPRGRRPARRCRSRLPAGPDSRAGQAAVWSQTAQFFNRQGRFDDAMAAYARLTRLDPGDPQPFYQLAVSYEEKVRKDASLASAQQADYLTAGIEAVDQALALRPDYFEALVYKSLLLRQQVRFETDPALQRTLVDEADGLQRQAIEAPQSTGWTTTPPVTLRPAAMP